MRIIRVIEDREVIKAILKPLGHWLVKSKPIPRPMPRLPDTSWIISLNPP